MLPNWYYNYKEKIDFCIKDYLEKHFEKQNSKAMETIKQATIYACKWWKRVRSVLALEFYLIISWKSISEIQNNEKIIKFCIALELLHAYSLVHDDLPCMDNDVLRRWELTVWKKYGEYNAILVWDLLNSLSFELISSIWNISLIKLFWDAVWINWMIGGQVLDLYYEYNPKELNIDNLIETHNKKTWALIEMSIKWGLILWNLCLETKDKKRKNKIRHYINFWKKIGLAFQIKDDLLDVEWTIEETGKSIGWEEKGFVYFIWIKKSKLKLKHLIKECLEDIKDLTSEKLNFLVNYIWNRKK